MSEILAQSSMLALTGRACTLTHLQGPRPGAALGEVLASLDLQELPRLGSSGGRDDLCLLRISPTATLLMIDEAIQIPRALTSEGAVGQAFMVAIDKTHAYTRIEMSGAKVQEFMAKGCSLDLDIRQFPPGASAATGFAGMRTILRRSMAGDRFDLLVGRSYAASLWRWMSDAAVEYGDP